MPKKGLLLGLFSVIGLFLGLGAAFLAEYLDDSLKTTEEVERVCQFPSLGLVPLLPVNGITGSNGRFPLKPSQLLSYVPLLGNHSQTEPVNGDGADLIVLKQPRSIISEAIRHVRTSLMLSASGGPPKIILITSPNPQEGKSTISCNLAASLALDGRQVVLLDCDLRKPRLHRVFHTLPQPGLTTHLTGNSGWEDIIKPTQVPNLWFAPAGPVPPSPTELLNSEAFKELLQRLSRDFQHVIIDTPPALGFADARVVSSLVDGVLLVMKHQSTPREAGRLTCQLFSQIHAHVLGIILNQVNSNGLGRYEYYYHPKYYGNYYENHEDEACDSEKTDLQPPIN
jgi:capsular exopolysaccharide synthesis family protein